MELAPDQNAMFEQQMYGMEDPNTEMIDQLDSDYIYLEMFRAFDFAGEGYIKPKDLFSASKFMGWESDQGKY